LRPAYRQARRDPARQAIEWRDFAQAALASAAFPFAQPPRAVSRPASDYDRIEVPLAGGSGQPAQFVPTWPLPVTQDAVFETQAVDGGVFNNDPVDLCRADLNARQVQASNPRDGSVADRAVLSVHALVHRVQPGALPPAAHVHAAFSEVALGFGRAIWNQSQINPAQMALALAPDVYSRFIIGPTRSDAFDEPSALAIAGGSLGGFGGYLERAFRRHDFQLGRRNAQQYLAQCLSLQPANPLFAGWSAAQRTHFRTRDGEYPIVPLLGDLHPDQRREPMPDWPFGLANVAGVRALLAQRLDAVTRGALRDLAPRSPLLRWIGWRVWRHRLRGPTRDRAEQWMRRSLDQHALT